MRSNFLEVMRQPYATTARAKGLPESLVIWKHIFPNAVNPLITLLGFEIASLLSGAALTEIVFSWPGLGRLILEAVMSYDLYLVMGSLFMGTILLIIGNLIADILLAFMDPRIKLS
jgi:peptide/nickel transport system permease protein